MNQQNAVTRLTEIACEEFLKHWQAVAARLRTGEDVAALRSDCFFAEGKAEQLLVSRCFYDESHANQLAALEAGAVAEQLKPWLGDAIAEAMPEDMDEAEFFAAIEDQRTYLGGLVRAEYVVLVNKKYLVHSNMVCAVPDEDVQYSDLYEISASGCSCGAKLKVFKSTGEAFSDSESISAEAGIRINFYGNAEEDGDPEDFWTLYFTGETDFAIEVEVYDCSEESAA